MISAAGAVIIALALLIHVQALFLLLQILASLPAAREMDRTRGSCPRVAVIIPAHNEDISIAATIRAIKPQLSGLDRLIVVADNCSDDTARIAGLEGAEVVERRDEQRVGKGYAVDYGIRFIARSGAPEVVIFVDADCEFEAGSVEELARVSMAHNRPVQATNLQEASASASRTVRIQQFALKVKNYVRPLGSSRLGLPCQLSGTGMAVPWSNISSVNFSTGHIAEDVKLGTDLAVAGHEPMFCPRAKVTSKFPESIQGNRVQRTRWEHGHLAMICEYVPHLFWNAFKNRRLSLGAIALDLSIPPLGLFATIMIALTGADVLVVLGGFPIWSVIVTGSMLPILGLAIGLAWYRHGRAIVSARDLLFIPVYALSKIGVLWRFLTKRQVVWVRSERNQDRIQRHRR
jgi:cellulose synthase/poly-beta-1,6-N-acetylglucosamine synthase-like glycosyltransferase